MGYPQPTWLDDSSQWRKHPKRRQHSQRHRHSCCQQTYLSDTRPGSAQVPFRRVAEADAGQFLAAFDDEVARGDDPHGRDRAAPLAQGD